MDLSEEMEVLLDQAEETVQQRLKANGEFQTFALTMSTDSDMPEEISSESKELGCAIGEILEKILPMVKRKELAATLICCPIPPEQVASEGWQAAMFDIEGLHHRRAYIVMPYRSRSYGGWEYRPLEFTPGVPQIFPA
ncbi:hypothetical protein [Herbaspirillum robiniae]|uniref:Uncharacterized protein n=1 Tax=Herbaspirillum robiniae TaxID=2014887 RepID=A0ABX2LWG9_9BURK|nr:hypothetical protein [Herbaspirillum robiniae]NUU02827.1 hypothetical protein [Herbaspirillum robiniae]